MAIPGTTRTTSPRFGLEKILPIHRLANICTTLRDQGATIALCHGAFDWLHPGHIRHLHAAKRMADILIVTLTEDRFIRKGPGRPVFNQQLRAESLAALAAVDYVATCPWETGVETIELIRPHFYVKGSDYRDAAKQGTGAINREQLAVERQGGKLVFTDEIRFSSTRLIENHFPHELSIS